MKEYFSVSELISIKSPDLPSSIRGLRNRAQKEGWRKLEGMCIKAIGKAGGGGYLYHFSLFSEVTQNLLAIAYQSDDDKARIEPKTENDLWATYNALPAKQKKICEKRLNTLQIYLDYRKSGHTKTASIVLTSQHRGIAERTIHNWLTLVEAHKRSDWLAALTSSYM